ncbi:MAG: CorA family divalent cation transporter [Lachnospiraceae bacterium]|nr:CorA family divalent cation transporter [Lachnospiraceae bacterium]
MTEYIKKSHDGGLLSADQNFAGQPSLVITNADEFREEKGNYIHYKELLHSLGSIRYCKAEMYRDCIWGTLRIPQKSKQREPLLSFGFYMTEHILFFIEDTGDLKKWVEKQIDRIQGFQSPDQLLLQFMELMVENDILYLSHLEKEMGAMEDALNHRIPKDFFAEVTKYRQKLSELNAYYEQLSAMGDLIQAHDSTSLIKSVELWNRYTLRTERLQNHVHLLRENILQLRELYQSQQDAQQNKIMCILTVVTTLFLPLTLLTGWYGMNFAYMPELHWKYGYLTVIIAAVVIVIAEILYFKKKKFF